MGDSREYVGRNKEEDFAGNAEAWKKRGRKSKGLAVQLGSKGSILNTIDHTTKALPTLTLEEINSLAEGKGVESKLEELLKLVTNLKQVVKARSASRKG
ncbi:MAG: hypothetical protein ACHQYP_02980 [Nitrospiria bacterium]